MAVGNHVFSTAECCKGWKLCIFTSWLVETMCFHQLVGGNHVFSTASRPVVHKWVASEDSG
jgi:hypothetical protein